MNDFEKHLLNDFQRDLPLTPRPYAEMADRLGVAEDDVIEALNILQEAGTVSRVGAVFKPRAVSESTLAAMAVPNDRLEDVANIVSGYQGVNHNYERDHRLNLWFVITAGDRTDIERVIGEIERRTGLTVLDLPMLDDYHLDLGFHLQWN